MLRLFVAVRLPQDVQARLAGLCAGLPGARWIAPENMHLTLRFIGSMPESELEDLDAALSRVAAPAFDLILDGVSYFGRERDARMVWVGVARNPALKSLQEKVDSALVRAGLPAETRKFTPHVTIGRLKKVAPGRLRDYLAANGPFQAGPVPVRDFSLYSSFLSHNGAIYEPLSDYPLTALSEPEATQDGLH